MRITIIVPIYGVEKYISKCLSSIASQTYSGEIECLLIDDCGTDNSISIAEAFIKDYSGNKYFRIIHRAENGGLSAARNTGLSAATGDYVLFVDSDDTLLPNSIETLVALAKNYPGVDIVQGNVEVQDGRTDLSEACCINPEYINDPKQVSNGLISNFPMTAWNKLIRTQLLRQNKISFKEGVLHEDEMFRWSLHKYATSICFTKEKTYWYRTDNQTSIMAGKDKSKSLLSMVSVLDEVANDRIETDAEVRFTRYLLCRNHKICKLPYCSAKTSILSYIDILSDDKRLPWITRVELKMWKAPCWVLKSTILMFFYRSFCKVVRILFYKS